MSRKTEDDPFGLKFTAKDLDEAYESWNCNCGPSALAAALGTTLQDVRHRLMPEFELKGYTPPSLMLQAVLRAKAQTSSVQIKSGRVAAAMIPRYAPKHGLIRIQWEGPWTASPHTAKWAYNFTHWIAVTRLESMLFAFDVNAGQQHYVDWLIETVPRIIESIGRANGKFFATHLWEIRRHGEAGEESRPGGQVLPTGERH